MSAVRACHDPPNLKECIVSRKDIFDRAYGSIPREVGMAFDVNWIPTYRGLKFYWYKLLRKITR